MSSVALSDDQLAALPEALRAKQRLFDRTGGLHAAGLVDPAGEMVLVREDVGRHNAIDTIAGWMRIHGVSGHDKIFYTTGRLTSEMVAGKSTSLPVDAYSIKRFS